MIPAYVSIILACVFLALLLLLHVLKPELDPGWRWISEYEIGRFGWMMRLAFFSWGASVLTLTLGLSPSLELSPGSIARWWLVAIAAALAGAGVFKTNAITDHTPSSENAIHAICGLIVILTFPVAATLVVSSLLRDASWSSSRYVLIAGTALTWVGLAVFLASNVVVSRKVRSAARVSDPEVRVGWQNRLMVVTYIVWIVLVSAVSLHL